MINPDLILDSKSLLGEGPWWDNDKELLFWIDSLGCKIYKYNPAANINHTIMTNQYIGCVIPRKGGGLISCMQNGIYHVDYENSNIDLVCGIENDIQDNRLNDGKCDSLGRLWFGSMSMITKKKDGKSETRGSFYNFSEKSGVIKVFGNVGVSNGIAWNEDETKMYYIDSMTRSVACFDFDIERALVRNKKYIIRIPDYDGLPDGMTIDEEGMLWIAHYGGFQVSRWDPSTGKKIDKIRIPVPNVTSCIFGGKNLDELFITTARADLKEDDLKKYPLSGGLFKAATSVKGRILYKFG